MKSGHIAAWAVTSVAHLTIRYSPFRVDEFLADMNYSILNSYNSPMVVKPCFKIKCEVELFPKFDENMSDFGESYYVHYMTIYTAW